MCTNDDQGRLDIYYNYDNLSKNVTKKMLSDRTPGVWKYREFLPVESKKNIVTLNEGGTPFIKANNLAKKIGLRNLYLKDETRNPTGSFKDRSMTVGLSKAIEFGAKTVATASSGNAAASLGAYSAKAGLRCFAFVLESASFSKIAQIHLYGANVVRVKQNQDGVDPTVHLLRMVVEEYGWYPCPSFGPFNPYQVEGPKTISYEIIEQLEWNIPDWVFVPVGSACLLTGVWKGFRDFLNVGFTDSMPKMAAIQSSGCPPLVKGFKEGKGPFEIQPWKDACTCASGLADLFPWDGDAALGFLKDSGTAEEVSDEEILEAQKLLASTEGIFAEPSGVTSLAGLKKLLDQGAIDRDENVTLLITGTGLKDPDVVKRMFKGAPMIEPSIEEFEKLQFKL
jgi:threonine synthase